MKKINILLAIISITQLTFAQLENIPLITVEGESTIKVMPDYAILAFKISRKITKEESARLIEIFNKEDTKLRLFGFDEDNIEVSYIQTEGGTYLKEIYITINDLSKLDKILLELGKLGFNNFHYFEYRVKDYKAYKDRARIQAIAEAKAKASLMAEALSQSIGKAHTVEEVFFPSYNWYYPKDQINNLTMELDADNYLIQPGYLNITSRVRVSFDLVK